MRSIQVVNVRWYNATAWYGVTLAHALQSAGHPSLVVGLEDTPPLWKARELGLETRALPLNSLNPVRLATLGGQMDRLLRDFRPDVVNCHRGEAFALWALLKKRHGFGLVRTRGDQRLPRNNPPNRILHRRVADAVIATNSRMARHFVDVLGVPDARVHSILGGVDRRRFRFDPVARREVRERCGFTDSDFVMGVVGRMDEVKGMRETIHAMALARPRLEAAGLHPRLLLIAFPSHYGEADAARWTAEAGLGELGESVRVSGRVERPQDWINALDLGILASLGSEAIARAALEIMACAIPLVSTNVGVMPDLLPARYLCEPGDEGALADLMVMGGDGEERAALRQVCARRMADLGVDDFCAQTLGLYRSIVAGRGM
ncbi:MAG: glycosyltransferase family 4 protein [Desulfovibrionaceae bacterium]|nr:glycosyltransferase family 4 protein [Desulfovibrionaceae bacterium]